MTVRFAPTRFPAPVTRARTAGDFTLSETRYGSDAALGMHAHEYACFVFVVEGTFLDRCGDADRDVAPGTLILRPAGDPHSNRFGPDGGRCLNVELPPSWLEDVQLPDGSIIFPGDLLGRRLYDEFRAGDELSPLAMESMAMALLADADRVRRRPPNTPPPWLSRARELLHDRMEERFTLASIAAEVRIHPIHLASTFQRFFGQSVGAYLRRLRIAEACRHLRETDMPLVNVALAAGFCDQSHFGRTFKRLLHATPRQYRAWSRS
jgi:AraC family transcriptional regulator